MEDSEKTTDRQSGDLSAAAAYGVVGDMAAWLCEDEYYTVSELMKLLETEEQGRAAMKVRFIENPHSWTMMRFQSSSSSVTINGNEESCGPSFSDSESSVMASVDTLGVKVWSGDVERWLEEGGAWGGKEEVARGVEEESVMESEMDGGDWGNEMLFCVD